MNQKQTMQRVLSLAEKGRSLTSPNPMVGAVVVKDGKIVGEGYHKKVGEPHAEIMAIRQAGNNSNNSTLYLNLEPCCHFGKTPPCTEAIIQAGIRKVLFSVKDPNLQVNGKGAKTLKQAGIEVKSGLFEKEATKLNEAYFKSKISGMPFVILKIEQTLDGKFIGNHTKKKNWVSLRSMNSLSGDLLFPDALVANTKAKLKVKLLDSIRVNRYRAGFQTPLGIILSSNNDQRQKNNPNLANKDTIVRRRSGLVWKARVKDRMDLLSLLKKLTQVGIASVLVEGRDVGALFLKHKLVDKIYFLVSLEIGGIDMVLRTYLGVDRISDAFRLRNVEYYNIGKGMLVSGYLK